MIEAFGALYGMGLIFVGGVLTVFLIGAVNKKARKLIEKYLWSGEE